MEKSWFGAQHSWDNTNQYLAIITQKRTPNPYGFQPTRFPTVRTHSHLSIYWSRRQRRTIWEFRTNLGGEDHLEACLLLWGPYAHSSIRSADTSPKGWKDPLRPARDWIATYQPRGYDWDGTLQGLTHLKLSPNYEVQTTRLALETQNLQPCSCWFKAT